MKSANGWPLVPLAEVLQLQRRWIKLQPTDLYREIGIRSYGNGIFHKAPIAGSTLGNKRVLRIEPGDLVFNNVFAWEGAVAVAGPQETGMVGSHRFVTYTVNSTRGTAEFLKLFFTTENGRAILLKASPGSAGRNKTLGLDRFISNSIPLPPSEEQRRIVGKIDRLVGRIDETRQLRNSLKTDAEALASSMHFALSKDRRVRMSDLVTLHEERVAVEPTTKYPQIGIRGFGGGLFGKSPVSGTETTYRHFNRLHDGMLVLSQVKGWEGAIAVCTSDLAGYFASPEYRTFRSIDATCDPNYLDMVVRSPWFRTLLQGATHGQGARRERTRPERFLEITLPMPGITDQRRAVKVLSRLKSIESLKIEAVEAQDALLPSILDRAFKGEL
jgi:type I restriction enzyme S subunit